jgi:hypothetical protein
VNQSCLINNQKVKNARVHDNAVGAHALDQSGLYVLKTNRNHLILKNKTSLPLFTSLSLSVFLLLSHSSRTLICVHPPSLESGDGVAAGAAAPPPKKNLFFF